MGAVGRCFDGPGPWLEEWILSVKALLTKSISTSTQTVENPPCIIIIIGSKFGDSRAKKANPGAA
jgi:hypothetical protein